MSLLFSLQLWGREGNLRYENQKNYIKIYKGETGRGMKLQSILTRKNFTCVFSM